MMTLSASARTATDGDDWVVPRCRTCLRSFDFSTGDVALVVRRAAFTVGRVAWEDSTDVEEGLFMYLVETDHGSSAYALVHGGACAAAASTLRWAEAPDVCFAFDRDGERLRIVDLWPATGWAAVLPTTSLDGRVHFEPLVCWALVQHQDGSRRLEGITRRAGANDEPGTFDFPEARGWLTYASAAEQLDATRLTEWTAVARDRAREPSPAATALATIRRCGRGW